MALAHSKLTTNIAYYSCHYDPSIAFSLGSFFPVLENLILKDHSFGKLFVT